MKQVGRLLVINSSRMLVMSGNRIVSSRRQRKFITVFRSPNIIRIATPVKLETIIGGRLGAIMDYIRDRIIPSVITGKPKNPVTLTNNYSRDWDPLRICILAITNLMKTEHICGENVWISLSNDRPATGRF